MIGAKNLAVHLCGAATRLRLVVDLTKSFGTSASGKTICIASSCGNRPLGKTNSYLGLNCYTKVGQTVDLSGAPTDRVATGMKGIEYWVDREAKQLNIEFSLSGNFGTSASGKTCLIASTSGNRPIGKTNITLGVNVYHKVGDTVDFSKIATAVPSGKSVTVGDMVFDFEDERYTTVNVDLTKFVSSDSISSPGFVPLGTMDDPKAAPLQSVQLMLKLIGKLPPPPKDGEDSDPDFTEVAEKNFGWKLVQTSDGSASMVFRWDRNATIGHSASGNVLIASSRGWSKIAPYVSVNFNVILKATSVLKEELDAVDMSTDNLTPPTPELQSKIRSAIEAFVASQSKAQLAETTLGAIRKKISEDIGVEFDAAMKSWFKTALFEAMNAATDSDEADRVVGKKSVRQ